MNAKRAAIGRQPINKRQIKTIHTIISALCMTDEEYRILLREFRVTTCKNLTWRQAEELIEDLQRKTGQPSPRRENKKRYAELDGRPGFATSAQCRMIAAMWAEVTRATTEDEREIALNNFLRRIAHVDHLRFLKNYQVEKVVKAIQEMKKAKEEREC